MKFQPILLALMLMPSALLAQSAEELRTASRRLKESANALPKLQPGQDQEAVTFVQLLSQSHALTLSTLSNYRLEQPDRLSDSFLKNCQMIANQTEKLVLLNATIGNSFSASSEASQKIKELNAKHVEIYKLLSPALLEFDRRELKLE